MRAQARASPGDTLPSSDINAPQRSSATTALSRLPSLPSAILPTLPEHTSGCSLEGPTQRSSLPSKQRSSIPAVAVVGPSSSSSVAGPDTPEAAGPAAGQGNPPGCRGKLVSLGPASVSAPLPRFSPDARHALPAEQQPLGIPPSWEKALLLPHSHNPPSQQPAQDPPPPITPTHPGTSRWSISSGTPRASPDATAPSSSAPKLQAAPPAPLFTFGAAPPMGVVALSPSTPSPSQASASTAVTSPGPLSSIRERGSGNAHRPAPILSIKDRFERSSAKQPQQELQPQASPQAQQLKLAELRPHGYSLSLKGQQAYLEEKRALALQQHEQQARELLKQQQELAQKREARRALSQQLSAGSAGGGLVLKAQPRAVHRQASVPVALEPLPDDDPRFECDEEFEAEAARQREAWDQRDSEPGNQGPQGDGPHPPQTQLQQHLQREQQRWQEQQQWSPQQQQVVQQQRGGGPGGGARAAAEGRGGERGSDEYEEEEQPPPPSEFLLHWLEQQVVLMEL